MPRPLPIAFLLFLTTTAHAQSTQPAPNEAAQRMLAAAEDSLTQIEILSTTRARSPEFVQLHLDTLNNLLHARLLTATTDPERANAYTLHAAYLDKLATTLAARLDLDTPSASLAMVNAAKSQAAWQQLLASPPTPDRAQREKELHNQLVADAAKMVEMIVDLEDIRARSPEFAQLLFDEQRNLMDVRRAGGASESQNAGAMKDYETFFVRMKEAGDTITDEGGKPLLIRVNYARAMLASDAARSANRPDDIQKAAAEVSAAAKVILDELLDLEEIRALSPEFLHLELLWMRRLLDAKLAQAIAPAQKSALLTAYQTSLTATATRIQKLNTDSPALTRALLQYAQSEADYLLATNH